MNLTLTGHHLEITPAIRAHVTTKLEKISRHFEHITGINVILSTDKLQHKVEVTIHLPGKDVHTESIDTDMYAAIDLVIDKLDRQVLKYKERQADRRTHGQSIKDLEPSA
jgi:putative sigma-54 modulation protein